MNGFLGFLDTKTYFGWWQLTKPLSQRKPVNLRIQELGLAAAYEQDDGTYRLIRKLMAMPFLPAGEIPAAFAKLRLRASTNGMKRLVSYTGLMWIESTTFPPKDWSVYGQAIRTNDLEGWHHGLNRRAGGRVHTPFYLLIQHLHREAKLSALQVRLVSDGKLKHLQRKTYCCLQAKIFDLWDDYASREKTAQQLLKARSHLNGPVRSV